MVRCGRGGSEGGPIELTTYPLPVWIPLAREPILPRLISTLLALSSSRTRICCTSRPRLCSRTSSSRLRRSSRFSAWPTSHDVSPSAPTRPRVVFRLTDQLPRPSAMPSTVTRDHKLSLFQAREAALVRENDNLQYLNEELVVSTPSSPCRPSPSL